MKKFSLIAVIFACGFTQSAYSGLPEDALAAYDNALANYVSADSAVTYVTAQKAYIDALSVSTNALYNQKKNQLTQQQQIQCLTLLNGAVNNIISGDSWRMSASSSKTSAYNKLGLAAYAYANAFYYTCLVECEACVNWCNQTLQQAAFASTMYDSAESKFDQVIAICN